MRYILQVAAIVGVSSGLEENLSLSCDNCEDHNSLLQANILQHGHVAPQPGTTSNLLLASVTSVAKSLTESSSTTTTPEAVQVAISAATAALDTMRPALAAEHEFAQNQVDNQFGEIESCRAHPMHGVLAKTENAEDVATQHASLTRCNEESADSQREQDSAQSHWDELVSALVNSQPGRLIATDFYSGFTTWKQWIETEESNVDTAFAALNAATAASETKTEECVTATSDYNEGFCQHRLLCAMLGACEAHETQVYHELVVEVTRGMSSRQDQSATIEQVDCLLDLLVSAVTSNNTIPADAMAECQAATGNDPSLVITFPSVPAAVECPAATTNDPVCPGLADVSDIDNWSGGEVDSAVGYAIVDGYEDDLDGGGWILAATFSNADGQQQDNWDWTMGEPFSGHWSSSALFGDCNSLQKADCKGQAWNSIVATELMVREDSDGHVGVRKWALIQPDTLHRIFANRKQRNIAASSTLIQDPNSEAMALAYRQSPGYLLVNTDLDGTGFREKCNDPMHPNECPTGNDGCHLVGYWARDLASQHNLQCSSGLGCAIDNNGRYQQKWQQCNGDVTTNRAGSVNYNAPSAKLTDHTIWLFVRGTVLAEVP